MMLKQYFIKQAIKELEIDKFIRDNFPMGDYSKIEMQRTPLGIKILIHTNKPGRIIGRSGRNINEMTDAIRQKFGLENPQLDVKIIRNPDLDARIVAKQIASSIERGFNHKKIGNLTIKRIMDAGAVGAEIIISGKFGKGKGMTSKFVEGYLKHCGQPAKDLVDYGFEEANTKPGKIGIKVKIMRYFMDIDGELKTKRPEKEIEQKGEEIVEQLENAEAEQAPAQESPEEKEKPKKARKKEAGNEKESGKATFKPADKKVKKPESKKEA
ncbi:MAG: 30S ribosomal protein S3 [Candidatus Aenigmarchaeota archaeon]|nr:30S ribosomal protein S3 [Candidatus Aenigmarchaeota archaeon]